MPSYEEYKSASKFARLRFKYGIFIMIACWLCLLFIIYYMVSHAEVIVSNPLVYGCDKADVKLECKCYNYQEDIEFYVNSTSIWLPETYFSDVDYYEEKAIENFNNWLKNYSE